MKVSTDRHIRSEQDLEDLIEIICDGQDYDGGQIEGMQRTLENISSILSKLIDILADKDILPEMAVSHIINKDIAFIKEK